MSIKFNSHTIIYLFLRGDMSKSACVSGLRITDICSLCDRTTALISRWDKIKHMVIVVIVNF